MKYFNFLFLFLKNMKYYGYFNSLKIIFYELNYFSIYKAFKEYKLINSSFTSYQHSNKKVKYNTGYLPTPYFFLIEIKKYLQKKKISKFNFIDLGCGYSRPAIFFNKYFNIKYFGFDINQKLLPAANKRGKFNFFCINLRNKSKLIKILKKKINKNNLNIFFIADPFDINLINEIISKLKKEKLLKIVILMNINFSNLNKKNLNIEFIKKLYKRNLIILKN